MAKLHCCLAGFSASDFLQIEGLAALVRSQLTAEWEFGTAGADACNLLLCNLDSAAGAAAWRDSAARSGPRAAATDGFVTSGGLTLTKPLRVHGPGGLVHVLNEAVQLGVALAGPGLAASAPGVHGPAPSRPGGLRSLLRALPAWLSGPAAPRPIQTPEPPASARPVGTVSGPVPSAPGIPDPAQAAPDRPAPALAAASPSVPQPAEGQLEARTQPDAADKVVVLDAMGCDLLGLLHRAKAASQVIVIRLDGIPPICAAPAAGMAFTFAKLQAVFDLPAEALAPTHVTVARNSYHGRTEVQPAHGSPPVTVPGIPIKDLFWVATLRCGGAGEVAGYREGAFKLLAWPDLAGLPHARHHVAWCSLLARRPTTAEALSEAAGTGLAEAALFLAACGELGILVRKDLPPGAAAAPPVPSRHASERATVLRSILNRLRLRP